ncbi:MAG: type IX secretion system membrane protein PorP/SprF [Cytophagales bacterium]
MKRIVYVCLAVITNWVMAQQAPHYTQYMINPFLVNPAVSGSEDYVDLKAGYRNQWINMDGAPTTMFLSGHAPLGKNKAMSSNRSKNKKNGWHGIGGVVSHDAIGPTTTTSFSGSYSYHLKLSEKLVGSFGVLGGLQRFLIDGNKLTTVTAGDAAVSSVSGTSLADLNTGVWLYSKTFYTGFSMVQVFPQKLVRSDANNGKLAQHMFLMGGVRIPFGYEGEFTFIPSAVMKIVYPAPITFDINAKLKYKDKVWAGVSYRRTDAVGLLAGFLVQNFEMSYSYDINTSSLRKYNGGSHEIIIGYRIPIVSRIICPSNFW